MSRVVYVSSRQQQGGCGCLALGLLVALLFFKSFWRPLLLLLLVVTIIGWIRSFFLSKDNHHSPDGVSSTNSEEVISDVYTSTHRPRKEAEIIEEE